MKEVELGREVVAYFEALGWDVYQEVPLDGTFADIVITREGCPRREVGIIECKVALSFDVMAQAYHWRNRANFLWVAVPRPTPLVSLSDGRRFAETVLRRFGIGLIELLQDGSGGSMRDRIPPGPMPCEVLMVEKTLRSIRPEHKTFTPAGSAAAARYTDFRATIEALRTLVRANPGIFLAEAIRKITHHYSSDPAAVSSISKWIEKGRIVGFELRAAPEGMRGRRIYVTEERKT